MRTSARRLGQHAGVAARRNDRQDPELIADLTGVEYGYVLRDGRDAIQLERKEDMKRRGLASPDDGDALALTFAYPVLAPRRSRRRSLYSFDYDPYALSPAELEDHGANRWDPFVQRRR
jgi:hypothetical protein